MEKEKRIYRLKKDKEDLRDKLFRCTSFKTTAELPKSVDLSTQCSAVVNQGSLGSCTANAIGSGLREFLMLKAGEPLSFMSRLWLYWQERLLEGTIAEDSGAYIRDGMKVLQTLGCAPERDWAYDVARFKETPPTQATVDAAAYKITEYHRILDLNGLKACLAEGYPVVIGIDVYESFESATVAKTGKVPLPKKSEQCLGGHAVLAVGYMLLGKTKYIKCRNSWGTEWGDKGYFYLPETYFKKGLVSDMWAGR